MSSLARLGLLAIAGRDRDALGREAVGVVRVAFAGGPARAAGLGRGDRILRAGAKPFHPVRSSRGRAVDPVTLEVGRRVAYMPTFSCTGGDHEEVLGESLAGDLRDADAPCSTSATAGAGAAPRPSTRSTPCPRDSRRSTARGLGRGRPPGGSRW